MTKICPSCKEEKDIEEFNLSKRHSDGRQSYCRSCRKTYDAAHFVRDRNRIVTRHYSRRKRNQLWFLEYRKTLKCEECGENHPATLDFHHKDPSQKDFDVSVLVTSDRSLETIKREIAKCKVLCSNCHRKLHWEETHNG